MRYSGRWPRSGMMRGGEVCEHRMWVPHTGEKDGSVSHGWPTPDAGVFNYAESPANFDSRRRKVKQKLKNGNGMGAVLAVEAKRWPTASASDWKGSTRPGQRRGQLTEKIEPHNPGRLNPEWVETLMGFPAGWTDIDGPPHQDHTSTHTSHPAPIPDNPPTSND